MLLTPSPEPGGCCFVAMVFPRRWGHAVSASFNSVARSRNEGGKSTCLQPATLRSTFDTIPLSMWLRCLLALGCFGLFQARSMVQRNSACEGALRRHMGTQREDVSHVAWTLSCGRSQCPTLSSEGLHPPVGRATSPSGTTLTTLFSRLAFHSRLTSLAFC